MEDPALLEARALTRFYGGRRGVEDVSLALGSGLYALLGPNGAGKTTLMRLLAGILRPTRGGVLFRGQDIWRDLMWFRMSLGYLPQEFGVYPEMTPYGFLSYLGRLKAVPESELPALVEETMIRLGLDPRDPSPLRRCSHGMKQLVGVAQAVFGNPHVILLDEPFAGLDPEMRLRVRDVLGDLATRKTVLVSTHVASDIEGTVDSLIVIHEGRALFHGTASQLLDAARGLVWQAEIADSQWKDLSRAITAVSLVRSGQTCTVRFVSREPVQFADARLVQDPTLEEAYLAYLRSTAIRGASRTVATG